MRNQVGGQGGQPALLYLVPFVLGTVLALGHRRGHLKEMWCAARKPNVQVRPDVLMHRLLSSGACSVRRETPAGQHGADHQPDRLVASAEEGAAGEAAAHEGNAEGNGAGRPDNKAAGGVDASSSRAGHQVKELWKPRHTTARQLFNLGRLCKAISPEADMDFAFRFARAKLGVGAGAGSTGEEGVQGVRLLAQRAATAKRRTQRGRCSRHLLAAVAANPAALLARDEQVECRRRRRGGARSRRRLCCFHKLAAGACAAIAA